MPACEPVLSANDCGALRPKHAYPVALFGCGKVGVMHRQGVYAEILAKPRWVNTGIQLTAGKGYQISATGTWTDWMRRNTCGPSGYPSNSWLLRVGERFRLQPDQPWFALVGAIGPDPTTQFAIGSSTTFKPSKTGELHCFANDAPFFRWNNKGHVTVFVDERVG